MLTHCHQYARISYKIHQVSVILEDFSDKLFRISHQEVCTMVWCMNNIPNTMMHNARVHFHMANLVKVCPIMLIFVVILFLIYKRMGAAHGYTCPHVVTRLTLRACIQACMDASEVFLPPFFLSCQAAIFGSCGAPAIACTPPPFWTPMWRGACTCETWARVHISVQVWSAQDCISSLMFRPQVHDKAFAGLLQNYVIWVNQVLWGQWI